MADDIENLETPFSEDLDPAKQIKHLRRALEYSNKRYSDLFKELPRRAALDAQLRHRLEQQETRNSALTSLLAKAEDSLEIATNLAKNLEDGLVHAEKYEAKFKNLNTLICSFKDQLPSGLVSAWEKIVKNG
jgi:predicted nuclease with TOPRIM domain